MAWLESHQAVWESAKTRKAARRLGIEEVHLVGHLHSLWHWAIDHAETGDVSKYDAEDLAIAARWRGDADQFLEALIECGPGETPGFLERDGSCGPPEDGRTGRLVIHDWWDYAGKLIARRMRDRARKRDSRSDGPSTGRPADPPPDTAGDVPSDTIGTGAGTSDRRPDAPPPDVHGTSNGQPQDRPSDAASRANQPTNSEPTKPLAPAAPPRNRDLLFEALIEVCGLRIDELTKSGRGAANKAAKELRDIGATPEGVRARAVEHRRRWSTAELTPTSLAKNYAQLGTSRNGQSPTAVETCQDCGQAMRSHDDETCRLVRGAA